MLLGLAKHESRRQPEPAAYSFSGVLLRVIKSDCTMHHPIKSLKYNRWSKGDGVGYNTIEERFKRIVIVWDGVRWLHSK